MLSCVAMLDRWIPCLLLCLLPAACSLQRDGLGRVIEESPVADDDDNDTTEPSDGGGNDGIAVEDLSPPLDSGGVIVVPKDSGGGDSPYQRDAGPG